MWGCLVNVCCPHRPACTMQLEPVDEAQAQPCAQGPPWANSRLPCRSHLQASPQLEPPNELLSLARPLCSPFSTLLMLLALPLYHPQSKTPHPQGLLSRPPSVRPSRIPTARNALSLRGSWLCICPSPQTLILPTQHLAAKHKCFLPT